MRLNGNTINFQDEIWSVTYPDLAIFDSVFIHDNAYAGDYVDHDHKKNLYRVIVGAKGVQLADQIDKLDSKIRDANNVIRIKKESVSKTLPNGVAIRAYLAWQADADIQNKIEQKNKEITNLQQTWDDWKRTDCDRRFGDEWPGRIPAQLVAHLLFFFSKQNDLVIDPMAGGGVVGDTCLAFNRRCWSFDMVDRPYEISRPGE